MENKMSCKKIKKILVTGASGFIATHLIRRLRKLNYKVVGKDSFLPKFSYKIANFNIDIFKKANPVNKEIEYKSDLNDARLKYSHSNNSNYIDTTNCFYNDTFKNFKFDLIIHLGAQTGVRGSVNDPESYIRDNIEGTNNIFELCRSKKIKNVIYASSSSVYGNNEIGFTDDGIFAKELKPKSIYAMTKKACEDMARIYWEQFKIKSVGLRFFTVYGPYGRPDMAVYKFARNIMQGKPIEVYNKDKELYRAFTYVDDIVDGIIGAVNNINKVKGAMVCDMGNDDSRPLQTLIELLEKEIGKKAIIKYKKKPKCDVDETHANNTKAEELFGYYPKVTLETGIKKFIKWLKKYEKV